MNGEYDAVGRALPVIARNRIGETLHAPPSPVSIGIDDSHPWLNQPGASFVTLRQGGQLRGCMGTIQAYQPLLEDVKCHAVSAALEDPRFPPLTKEELPLTDIEVSVLSSPELLSVVDEADALKQLRPGIDGVVLEYGPYRGTFLPQVWEVLPEPSRFLAALKQKAGLPPDFWREGIRLFRYRVRKWSDAA